MQHADALSLTPVVSIRISTLSWTEFEETQNLSEDIVLIRRWVLNSLRPDTKLKDASPTLKALCNVSEFWSLKGIHVLCRKYEIQTLVPGLPNLQF